MTKKGNGLSWKSKDQLICVYEDSNFEKKITEVNKTCNEIESTVPILLGISKPVL